MNNYFKPASILFYLLMLLVFFFVGVYAVRLLGAADNQGLAGGAIVLVWGLLFSGVAFISSFFIVRAIAIKKIVKLNLLLFIILVASIVITYLNYQARQALKDNPEENQEQPERKPVTPTAMLLTKSNFENTIAKAESISENEMGLGFFTPNYYEFPVLYFYGDVNLEKTIDDHTPQDSVVFIQQEGYKLSTSYAPPWLFPEHLKLDYELMAFKVLGLGNDFLKVEVNKTTGQIAYLDKYKGTYKTWPEFLRTMASLELIEKENQTVHIKPLQHASTVQVAFKWMQPLLIERNWMYVKLLDEHHKEQGKGWVQWRNEEQLLVRYSLFG